MKIRLVLILIVTTISSYAQYEARKDSLTIDSLLYIIQQQKNDTHHINALLSVVDLTYERDLDSAFSIAERIVKLSSKIQFNKGNVKGLEWQGYILGRQSKYNQALRFHRKCLILETSVENKKGEANALNNLGMIHYRSGNIDSTIFYFKASLDIEEIIGNLQGIAASLNNIGYIIKAQGRTDEALEYYIRAIEIKEKIGNGLALSNSYNNIAVIYSSIGDIQTSLEYQHKALKLREAEANSIVIANSLGNIASIHVQLNDPETALDFFNRALKLQKKTSDKAGMGITLLNIGNLHKDEGNYVMALNFYMQSMKVERESKHRKGIAITSISIGEMYIELDKQEEAREYLDTALKICLNLEDLNWEIRSLNGLGHIAYKNGNYLLAIEYGKIALEKSEKLGFPVNIKASSLLLFRSYKKVGNLQQALNMHELHLVMSDSINNQEDQRAAAKQQAKYEYEKQKSLDDAAYEKQLAVEQGQQQKQKVISYSAGGGLVLILGFLLFVFNRLKVTREQKEAIDTQKKEIEKTHEQLSEHHKKISESITYAQRLQRAILPSAKEVGQHIKENFILFNPKDVVSGDFYWFEHTEGTSYIAAADCTGHGVPGAMVSVVCSNALNRCVKEFGLRDPSKILDKTRDLVIETFAKSGENVKDGMDIAICAIKNNKLTFAGANNPLWIVRQTEHLTDIQKEERSTYLGDKVSLIEYKASKQPIGLYEGMKPFEQQEIELYKGDSIYIFSDGFADQFGGPKRKKLKHKPFKKLLLDIADTPMNQQSELILSDFNNWKGDYEQIDDVVVIGIRI